MGTRRTARRSYIAASKTAPVVLGGNIIHYSVGAL
jgi:hypothetical protein